jgi:hypothetical protein
VKSTNTPAEDSGPTARSLFEGLAGRLGSVALAITSRIRAEVPGYAVLPLSEHSADVDRQIRNVVAGLMAGATPSAAAIEHARGVGRRRAADAIALPDVIEAYHIAYREIWSELLADAQRTDPSLLNQLASQVSLLWLWFHRLSAAVAESHAAESQARHSNRLALERDFLDQLLGRAAHDDAAAAVLGYRVGDPFIVACVAGLGQRDAEQVTEALRQESDRVMCVYSDGRGVVVAQDLPAGTICDVVKNVRPGAFVGLGMPRSGPRGAEVSLLDATEALERADETRPFVEFGEDWLMSCLNAVKPRFEDLLHQTVAVIRAHPQLAQTVRAYADCRYSVSACARQLHIHPNSARYRLDRWRNLTGWDVETFNGLTASIIALELMTDDRRGSGR